MIDIDMKTEKTILIIEDDHAIRGDLESLLKLEGYTALTAANGEIALKLMAESTQIPDVILLDIMMPVMDGWKFREAQVLLPRIASIPVLVMTADGHAPEKAEKMNANGFVKKIDIEKLLDLVGQC